MKFRSYFRALATKLKLKKCGANVTIKKNICINFSSLEIGDNVTILDDARIQNVSGNKDTTISIGNNTGIQYRFTILAGANVTIGNNVAIASDVFISAGSHGIDPESTISYGCQPYIGKEIIIEDGAWIGEKVVILSGCTIGQKSIIGAGSVVTKNIPPYSIAVGNPAKVIKKYNFAAHKWEKNVE